MEGVELRIGLAPAAIGEAEIGIAEHADKADLRDVERAATARQACFSNRAMPVQARFQ